jgi:hypothetical protein
MLPGRGVPHPHLPLVVKTDMRLGDVDLDAMKACVGHRLRTIHSPLHALTYRTHPLLKMRKNLTDMYGFYFVPLGQKTILPFREPASRTGVLLDGNSRGGSVSLRKGGKGYSVMAG